MPINLWFWLKFSTMADISSLDVVVQFSIGCEISF